MTKKKLFFIVLVLLFSSCFTGCIPNNMRYNGGFGIYINQKFAKKLETCSHYATPTYYYTISILDFRKHKLKIVGQENNTCKIELYDKSILLGSNINDTYFIPMQYVKDLSSIMQQSFKEPPYHEIEAVKKTIAFCRELDIIPCIIHDEENEEALYLYMNAIRDYFKYNYNSNKKSK